jgi:CheY-like chemotaxis protein
VSHEIRTPISGIIGLSELLYGSRIGKEHTDLVGDIRTSAQFLLTLVNDILDLSKIEVGLLSLESLPFTLCETIQETFVPLQLQAKEKGLRLGWTCDTGVTTATMLGDPHRLRQILTNLVGNSIKFTHTGTICLCVKTLQSEGSEAINIQFVVQDSGIGIADDAKSLLFKPFSQANSSTARIYGGTGLGLSICQELIELMGGHINLQSTLGKGTTITFNVQFKIDSSSRLPERTRTENLSEVTVAEDLTEQNSVQTQFSQRSDSKASESNISILIADDNVINRKINSLFIMRSGYEVATVCDGQEALDYLCRSSAQPRPDLIFMDCMMPGIDGYEATRRIRTDTDMFDEQTRRLPIVALSASVLQRDKERCWEVGMNDYISRPIYQQTLKDAVLKWTLPKDT